MRKSLNYVGVGIVLGVSIGVATGHLATGVAMGVLFGAVMNVAKARRNAQLQKPD